MASGGSRAENMEEAPTDRREGAGAVFDKAYAGMHRPDSGVMLLIGRPRVDRRSAHRHRVQRRLARTVVQIQ